MEGILLRSSRYGTQLYQTHVFPSRYQPAEQAQKEFEKKKLFDEIQWTQYKLMVPAGKERSLIRGQ
jgi:hypothetical protein